MRPLLVSLYKRRQVCSTLGLSTCEEAKVHSSASSSTSCSAGGAICGSDPCGSVTATAASRGGSKPSGSALVQPGVSEPPTLGAGATGCSPGESASRESVTGAGLSEATERLSVATDTLNSSGQKGTSRDACSSGKPAGAAAREVTPASPGAQRLGLGLGLAFGCRLLSAPAVPADVSLRPTGFIMSGGGKGRPCFLASGGLVQAALRRACVETHQEALPLLPTGTPSNLLQPATPWLLHPRTLSLGVEKTPSFTKRLLP